MALLKEKHVQLCKTSVLLHTVCTQCAACLYNYILSGNVWRGQYISITVLYKEWPSDLKKEKKKRKCFYWMQRNSATTKNNKTYLHFFFNLYYVFLIGQTDFVFRNVFFGIPGPPYSYHFLARPHPKNNRMGQLCKKG